MSYIVNVVILIFGTFLSLLTEKGSCVDDSCLEELAFGPSFDFIGGRASWVTGLAGLISACDHVEFQSSIVLCIQVEIIMPIDLLPTRLAVIQTQRLVVQSLLKTFPKHSEVLLRAGANLDLHLVVR